MGFVQHYPDNSEPEDEKEYEEILYVCVEDYETVEHDEVKHVNTEQERQEEV